MSPCSFHFISSASRCSISNEKSIRGEVEIIGGLSKGKIQRNKVLIHSFSFLVHKPWGSSRGLIINDGLKADMMVSSRSAAYKHLNLNPVLLARRRTISEANFWPNIL